MTKQDIKLELAQQESSKGEDLPDQAMMEILAEYESTLEFPDKKPEHLYALCPAGLPGTGKTTIAKELSKRLNLLRLNNDELRDLLSYKGYNLLRVMDISKILFEKYAKQGYSLAIDADCAGKFIIQKWDKIVEAAGLKLVWIHINTPEDYVIPKIKEYRTEQSLKDYYRRQPLHKDLDLPFIYMFDLSKANLEEQYDESEELIRQETNNLNK